MCVGHNDNGILFVSSKRKHGMAEPGLKSLCACEAAPSPKPAAL